VVAVTSADHGLATLELFHSRPIAPTRRIAIGLHYLPVHGGPGPGGILLGGIVSRFARELDEDDLDEVDDLLDDLVERRRVVQPRLRHRLQEDRIGLLKSVHRLDAGADGPTFRIADVGSPLVNVLGACYVVPSLPAALQTDVWPAIRRALRWRGPIDGSFVAALHGARDVAGWMAAAEPLAWALGVLGFDPDDDPTNREVRRRFRDALRVAHPDHGGADDEAAARIADLTEARRILLG